MAKFKLSFQVLVMGALLSCCLSQQKGDCLAPANRWVRIGHMELRLSCPCRFPGAAGSQSNFRVQWYKLVEGTWQLQRTEAGVDRFSTQVHNDSVGGRYLCECSPCHQQFCGRCFRVGVEPAITAFTVQPRIARVGESLYLNCSAMGHPAPRYEITKMGSNPNIPVGSNYEESGVLTISNATLSTGGSYTCLVHCGFDNAHSYTNATNVNVTIYDPPKVVRVANGTAAPGNDSVANLQCYVENTTLTHVTWFKGSKELHPSYNYSFVTYVFEIENRSIVRFLLTVHLVSERDFGEYRCRIGSLYNSSEDVASVWILSPSPAHTVEPPVGKDDHGVGWTIGGIFVAVVVFVLAVIVIAVGIWALVKKKDPRRQQEGIDDQNNAAVRNPLSPRYVPPPLGDTAASQSENGGVTTQETTETSSVISDPHDGDDMSFEHSSWRSSSSALPGNSISRVAPSASPDSTENRHLLIAGGSNGVTSGQLEGHQVPAKTTNVLLTLESKGLHRRSIAQMKNSVSPDIKFHWQQQQW